jgi:predicted acyltransferase (DUF342 family)
MSVQPPRKFTQDVRDTYLASIRAGNMRNESARIAGISSKTVAKYRRNDIEFSEDEAMAFDEANEGVEKVLRDMALLGDISAIKLWLAAHKRSQYGQKTTIEVDATDKAVEMSNANALTQIASLQVTLEARRIAIESENPTSFIDVQSQELSP